MAEPFRAALPRRPVRAGRRSRARHLLPVVLVGVLVAGCSDQGPAAAEDPGMLHVHGLGVDASTGEVLAATHTGLFVVSESGEARRVADQFRDLMSFAVDGDRLLASGHPALGEDLPVHLGLVESTDRGRTWQPVSLEGEVDLHALTADGSTIVGYDSVSRQVMTSDDDGASWVRGPELEAVADLALLPGGRVVATSPDGLLVSDDAGGRFVPFEPQSPVLLTQVEVDDGDAVVGISQDGSLWRLERDSWSQVGAVTGPVTALVTAADGALVVATDTAILRSEDGGQAWQPLAPLAAGEQ